MPEIGIRELKAHASDVLREVRERRTRYTVTYRGRPIGLLVPIGESGDETPTEAWDKLMRLGKEIGSGWRSPLSSEQLLSEMRR
jgi:prevent-host-death family protein